MVVVVGLWWWLWWWWVLLWGRDAKAARPFDASTRKTPIVAGAQIEMRSAPMVGEVPKEGGGMTMAAC